METRAQAFREIFSTWKAKLFVIVPTVAGGYQFGCDQLDWPKLPALWGMTNALIPWWAWLLLAQAGFIYALFEYVRRNVALPNGSANDAPRIYDDSSLDVRINAITENLQKINNDLESSNRKIDDNTKASDQLIYRFRAGKILELIESLDLAVMGDHDVEDADRYKKGIQELGKAEHILNRFKPGYREEGRIRGERIKADPLYAIVDPDEASRWKTGREKQSWYLYMDRVSVVSNYIEALRSEEQRRLINSGEYLIGESR